jgi:hypothetical protein
MLGVPYSVKAVAYPLYIYVFIKKSPRKNSEKKFREKKVFYISLYNFNFLRAMKLTLDEFEQDLLIESLEYVMENNEHLVLLDGKKEDLQELLRKIEDSVYE